MTLKEILELAGVGFVVVAAAVMWVVCMCAVVVFYAAMVGGTIGAIGYAAWVMFKLFSGG